MKKIALFLAVSGALLLMGQSLLQFGTYVTNLPAATSIASTDVLYINQSGISRKLPANLITTAATTQGNIVARFGSMDVCQRGAGSGCSFAVPASTTQYTVDGCYLNTGFNQASTVGSIAGLSAVGALSSNRAAAITRNSGQTGVGSLSFGCPLDSDEISLMQRQLVTLSAVLSAGANFSPINGNVFIFLECGTGAPTKFANGYTNATNVASITTSLIAGGPAVRVQITTFNPIPSNCTQAEILFSWPTTGTAGAADTLNIDSVQLEIASSSSSVATQFQQLDFGTQLRMAQRHYQKTFIYTTAPVQNAGTNTGEVDGSVFKAAGGTFNILPYRFLGEMRVSPVVTSFNPSAANAQVRNESTGVDMSATAITGITTNSLYLTYTSDAGSVVGSQTGVHLTLDSGI